MRYRKHEVVLFQVMHHDELAFEFDEMTKFVGLEIPEELMAQPDRIRRSVFERDGGLQPPLGRPLPAQSHRAGAGRYEPRHG